MAKVELNIPDHLDVKISRLVEEGEFVDREEAVRELISAGVKAFQTPNGGTTYDDPMDDPTEDHFGHEDEYVF